ncbi:MULTISPECIES: tetratricopeptide repeat protein [Sorangium]|uniref:Tetratricopeptide repeat protein n=1 Tax=Sorangium atrum TaxID=2995308 RepID=A0ABT5CCL5_9BACT|nr:tetratricopeptide repeat protein [Sorangium aterium]MDC0682867.1 tetratricopeptide repeat protein [Sorangium aterium]
MRASRWFFVMLVGCALSGVPSGAAEAEGRPADLFQLSYDAEAAGKVQDALAALDRLPAPQKDGYVAELRRGWLYHKLGRNKEAVDAYGRASALEPRSVESRVGALLPQMALRRWADVEATARKALQLDPANYLASLRLAFALYNLARYPEAATIYGRLAEMYPSDVEVRSGLGWSLLKMGKGGDAARELRRVLDIAPKHALARDGLRAAGVSN